MVQIKESPWNIPGTKNKSIDRVQLYEENQQEVRYDNTGIQESSSWVQYGEKFG